MWALSAAIRVVSGDGSMRTSTGDVYTIGETALGENEHRQ